MRSESSEMDKSFDIQVPWIIAEDTEMTLDVYDKRLLGSKRYFIRFDLYPLYAPSHMQRHHGFWDIPLKHVKRERTTLTLKQGELCVKNGWRTVRVKPGWKGNLEFIGYSMLHVSLWDFSKKPPEQLTVRSSQHVLMQGNRDLPLEHVYLSVTQRCNLNCEMCMRHNPKDWDAGDVAPDVLNPVLEASPFLHSVFVGGIGEPLLYGNLCGVVSELKRRMPGDSQVGFNTNGTLMTKQIASLLIDMGLNWITFSVDGATKFTYERIRTGSNFNEVVENIAHTIEYRNASGQKKLWLQANYVIQKENVHEIPAFAGLAGTLGLDSITFTHLRDFKVGEFRVLDEDVLAPLFTKASAVGDSYGVKIIFPRLRPLDELRCPFMQSAYVWLSGEVVPCCRMLKGAYPGIIRTFDNVRRKPLLDIWNSTEYRAFRQGVLTRNFPDECKGCSYITGLFS